MKKHANPRLKPAVTWMRASALLLAFIFIACRAAFAAGHMRIDGPELEKMMKSGQKLVIVDLREPELFKDGHVPGAVNIPYDGAKQRILKELSPKDTIVFICHGGPMGDELGAMLTANGYKKVYNVMGGMRKWKGPILIK
ncbi:MAG: rhodanese-like domain-containing protein [Deltaproteobacteria bacterium]|nr:rhodanese-like domain-containing protein [Deltaproteobacteria bacterium]